MHFAENARLQRQENRYNNATPRKNLTPAVATTVHRCAIGVRATRNPQIFSSMHNGFNISGRKQPYTCLDRKGFKVKQAAKWIGIGFGAHVQVERQPGDLAGRDGLPLRHAD